MEPQTTSSSSKLIVSIIVILVIVGVAIALVRSNDGGAGDDNATTERNEGSFVGSIWDIVRGGDDRKCTWENEKDGTKIEGVIYASQGKFRSDIESEAGGATITSHTLSDGAFIYNWTSLSAQGTKFRTSTSDDVAVPPTVTEMAPFVEEYDFDCDGWTADAATFALPGGVAFTEVSM